MSTIKIDRDEIQGPWVTPPECGGQIVEVSFACTETYILRRTFDRSDRSGKIEAFAWPAVGEFEPQNRTPRLGARVGIVEIGGGE